jgi:hypothetical protein
MDLRLQKAGERMVRLLETAFQNLQWNYDYIELPNVTANFRNFISESATEVRLYRTTQHTV